jgi:predicted SprT family Zn-dependent metalloprotease
VRARRVGRQLELFGPPPAGDRATAAARLADTLAELLSERVRLTVHDNRSTMVSFRRGDGGVHFRVHHMFLDAPEEVVRALVGFAGRGHRAPAARRIDAWVRSHRARIAPPRPARVNPRGRHHDLEAIFDRLNAEHFDGAVDARIGWGFTRRRRRRRTIKTGVYLHEARLIRIHPALDSKEVPEFYVAAVVFHEMLHCVVPALEAGVRRVVHGPEFRRLERAYPDFARARTWEEIHLHLLLRHRDGG